MSNKITLANAKIAKTVPAFIYGATMFVTRSAHYRPANNPNDRTITAIVAWKSTDKTKKVVDGALTEIENETVEAIHVTVRGVQESWGLKAGDKIEGINGYTKSEFSNNANKTEIVTFGLIDMDPEVIKALAEEYSYAEGDRPCDAIITTNKSNDTSGDISVPNGNRGVLPNASAKPVIPGATTGIQL